MKKLHASLVFITLAISSHLDAYQFFLHCPWRSTYSTSSEKKTEVPEKKICYFCKVCGEHDDARNTILKRTENFIIKLNDFPVTKGHLLIAPCKHVRTIPDLSVQIRSELMELISTTMHILEVELHCTSMNVGANIGPLASASIPDHLHMHIVPRYANEGISFLETIGNTRAIPWSMEELYKQLLPYFKTPIHTINSVHIEKK